jgi:thiamine pyrophosphate-dependent acetolactate synthase large subunit-like protein
MLKGAEIVLRCVRAEGVDLVFGYPGGAIMPLYDALEGSGVRHVLTRHEQGAVFAAEGYARVTGKVGVAMATSGPGATNLVTGIADAKMDSVPLVCITGQVRTAMIGTDAFQETDVFGVTLSLTKWSRLVRTIDEIPEVIAEGFHWARSGRPGPVLIDIPTDILKAKKEFSGPVKFTPHPRPAAGWSGGEAFGSDSETSATARRFEYSDIRHRARIGGSTAGVSLLLGNGWDARHAGGQHGFARDGFIAGFRSPPR